MILLGLPDIDQEKARALSLAGRAVLKRLQKEAPQSPVSETAATVLRNALEAHLTARSELAAGAIVSVSLYRPGGRNTVYDRSNLAELDRAIETLRTRVSLDERVLA